MSPCSTARSAAPRLTAYLLAAVACVGCYSAAKPTPIAPRLPPVAQGTPIKAALSGERRATIVTDEEQWPEGEPIETLVYGDARLTYQQARTLTDPAWHAKLERHRALTDKCAGARGPRYLGYLAVVAGIGVYSYGALVFQDRPQTIQMISLGLGGIGATSYLAGWAFFGGWACNSANDLWEALDLDQAGERRISDPRLTREVREVVLRFNREQKALAQGAGAKGGEDGEDGEDE